VEDVGVNSKTNCKYSEPFVTDVESSSAVERKNKVKKAIKKQKKEANKIPVIAL
jgi:hypothetical protein